MCVSAPAAAAGCSGTAADEAAPDTTGDPPPGDLVKVHIHTDSPDAVFKLIKSEFSDKPIPIKEKVEDMHTQVKNSKRGYTPDDFKVTLVFDSTCLTEPWVAEGFAHCPIICTIRSAFSVTPRGWDFVL